MAFLWWGASCISTPYAASSYKHHRRVWTAAATAALLLFVLQLLAQLLYGLHMLPTDGSHANTAPVGHWQAAGTHAGLIGHAGGKNSLQEQQGAVLGQAAAAGTSFSSGEASSPASIAAVVLEALGLGSMEGFSVGYILLVSSSWSGV